MNMIWHNNVFVQNRIRKMFGNSQPTFTGNFSCIVQYHFMSELITGFKILNPDDDFPKQTFSILNTNGNKIQSCLRIIVSFQADAVTVMDIWIVIVHLFFDCVITGTKCCALTVYILSLFFPVSNTCINPFFCSLNLSVLVLSSCISLSAACSALAIAICSSSGGSFILIFEKRSYHK